MLNLSSVARMAAKTATSSKGRIIMKTGTSRIVRDTVLRHPPIPVGKLPFPSKLPTGHSKILDIIGKNTGMVKRINIEWGGKTYKDILTRLAEKTHISKLVDIAQKLDSVTKDITITEDQILDAVEFFWEQTHKDDSYDYYEDYEDDYPDEEYVTVGDITLTQEEYEEAIRLYKTYLLIKSLDEAKGAESS